MIAQKYSLLQMEYTCPLLAHKLDDRGSCCNAHRHEWAKVKWDS